VPKTPGRAVPRNRTRSRVLLKISGEGLSGSGDDRYDAAAIRTLARELVSLARDRVEAAVVVGGGNLVRGRDLPGDLVERTAADAAGMLATIANALVLAAAVRAAGGKARVLTSVPMPDVAETFTADRARACLAAGETVLVGGGTGRPYFTTDTAAALRALEVGAGVLLKATKVDGVYDKDPMKHADAKRYAKVSYRDALVQDLRVMDSTAFALCKENDLPIVVFDLRTPGNVVRVLCGEPVGTLILKEV